MAITIKESLANLKILQADYQQFHDDIWQDPESYGIIAESLRVAIDTMKKFQKIQEIVKNTQQLCSYGSAFIDIREVIEDGNDNQNRK